MAKRAILLTASCAALLAGSLASRAAPFGELYHPSETRGFASTILDPAIAKWLMRLPQDVAFPQAAEADPAPAEERLAEHGLAEHGLAGDMLAATPIGGKVHEMMPPERAASAPAPAAEGVLTAQMLDAAPIGGEVYRFTTPARADLTASISKPEPIKPEPMKPEAIKPEPSAPAATASVLKRETGVAVWYRLPGRTATGEVADPHALTAGHRTLPLGSRVRVVNRLNGASVVVRINDRGPRQKKFVIDLSQASAKAIGLTGTAPVTLNVEQWGAVAANSPRTPTLEGRSVVNHGAKIHTGAKPREKRVH